MRRPAARLLITGVVIGCLAGAPAPGAEPVPATPPASASPFVYPPELEPDVRFWIRIYTEVGSDQGLLHDDHNLGLVYELVRFDGELAAGRREKQVADARARYAMLLRRFAAGDTGNLDRHERRILHAFGDKATPAQFIDAIGHIRFQLGQADRFHEGLQRAAFWEAHIARTLHDLGVPEEIAALPHVESSFRTSAYSRVGAAGLWQFMPATARRFMRVDDVVDQRLDPYSATEAAANLMLYNYRLLGTWPLTVTAYNHGPGGLRRAQDELGTSDIAVIIRRYQGATFGFASRNFYVAFLAALEVDRHAERYFGPITRLPNTDSYTTELPDYVPIGALAAAFEADPGALRVLNPALRPPVWNGTRFVPRGYALRLPGLAPAPAQLAACWARLPADQRFLAQRGQRVSLPRPLTHADQGARPATKAAAPAAPAAELRDTLLREPPPIEASLPPPGVRGGTERVFDREAGAAALAPAATPEPAGGADAADYRIAGDSVVVQAAETLGQFADWSGVSAARLRSLNHLRNGVVGIGRKVTLDLSQVSAADFEAARRDYHRRLQDAFFASHRIAGTETHAVKRGESLWTIAQQRADLPIWLVAQYNPDVDFNDVRPGTPVVLPHVVMINRR